MLEKKIQAIILVALLVVVVTVVLKYAMPEAPGPDHADGGIVQSHSSEATLAPSKENASKVLKDKIDHLRHVVEKDSTNSAIAFEVARLLQDSHNSQAAARYYALGLKSDTANNGGRIDYALCLYDLGMSGEALLQCRLVLRNDPGNAEALFNIGAIYGNGGVRDSAEAYWAKLISKHPKNELALRARENLKTLDGKLPSL